MSVLACHIPPPSAAMHARIQPTHITPTVPKSQFVFARVRGNICLAQCMSPYFRGIIVLPLIILLAPVQLTTPGSILSALSVTEAAIFVHEFINIFRFSHHAIIHPSEISVIDPIDEQCIRYEEDNGTVFLSKDVMERLRKLTPVVRPAPGRSTRNRRKVGY